MFSSQEKERLSTRVPCTALTGYSKCIEIETILLNTLGRSSRKLWGHPALKRGAVLPPCFMSAAKTTDRLPGARAVSDSQPSDDSDGKTSDKQNSSVEVHSRLL